MRPITRTHRQRSREVSSHHAVEAAAFGKSVPIGIPRLFSFQVSRGRPWATARARPTTTGCRSCADSTAAATLRMRNPIRRRGSPGGGAAECRVQAAGTNGLGARLRPPRSRRCARARMRTVGIRRA
jgi:hypothetical protein